MFWSQSQFLGAKTIADKRKMVVATYKNGIFSSFYQNPKQQAHNGP